MNARLLAKLLRRAPAPAPIRLLGGGCDSILVSANLVPSPALRRMRYVAALARAGVSPKHLRHQIRAELGAAVQAAWRTGARPNFRRLAAQMRVFSL